MNGTCLYEDNLICQVPFMSKSLVTYDSKTTSVFPYDIFFTIPFYYFILQHFINFLRRSVQLNSRPFEIPEETTVEDVVDSEGDMEVEVSEEEVDDPESSDDKWLFTGRYLELPGMIILLTSCNGSWRFQLKDSYYYTTQKVVDTLSKQLVKSKD